MMRIRSVIAKTDDRFKGVAHCPVFHINLTKFLAKFHFIHTGSSQRNQLTHALIVHQGSRTHFFLLFGCLHLTDMVDDIGSVDILVAHAKLHEAKQETCRPGLVDADGAAFSHMGSQHAHSVVRVVKINYRET